MCGRFALYTPPARLARYFEANLDADLDPQGLPSYNVAPTDRVLGLRLEGDDGRLLGAYRWGLIPADAPDPSVGGRLINARADSLLRRPSFRDGYRQRRLVVPADGFFEWRKDTGRSEPYFFTCVDGTPMAFAGLWAEWEDPQLKDGPAPPIRSCTIITTAANGDVEPVHSRMPVVLPPDAIDVWLDPGFDREELDGLLVPPADGTLQHHPVDRRVGNVRNNDPSLVAPVEGDETAGPGGDAGRTRTRGTEQLSLLGESDGGDGTGGGRVAPGLEEGEG